MRRRFLTILAVAALGGCDDADSSGRQQLDELTPEQAVEFCASVSITRQLGRATACDVDLVLDGQYIFRDLTCDEAVAECRLEFDDSLLRSCERSAPDAFRTCPATVSTYRNCVREQVAILQPAYDSVQVGCDMEPSNDAIRALAVAYRQAQAAPSCQALREQCSAEPGEPEPAEPEPIEPEPAEPEPAEPEPAEPEPRPMYTTVLVIDDGSPDDGEGSSGVDVCEVSADCANAFSAEIMLGGGEVCFAEGPGCVTGRADPDVVLEAGGCAADTVPSDYVSLGGDGVLEVGFDGDLAGCTISVTVLDNPESARWAAYVCDSGNLERARCVSDGEPAHSVPEGGSASFPVPAE